jgi:transposase
MRAVFNALRYLVRTGCGWRYLPLDLPLWEAVCQQWTRWRDNRCFDHILAYLRELARVLAGCEAAPTAVVLNSYMVQRTPESGACASYDGAKRRKGRQQVVVDTLGHLLAAVVTLANEPDRGQVAALCERVQQVTGQHMQAAYVDQGYMGEDAEYAATVHDIDLQVIAKPKGQTGFVLLPRHWVVERSFVWAARFGRLARDYERLALTMQQLYFLAFVTLLLAKGVFKLLAHNSL